MRKNKVWVVVALLALTAACGSSKKNVDADKSTSTTSTSALAAADTTIAPAAGATTTPTAAGGTATTAKTAGTTATTTKATTASGVPTPAASGTYDYAQSGTSSIGAVPAASKVVADAPNGSVQVLHVYVDPSQPPNDSSINYSANGPFITDEVVRGGGQTFTCHFDGAGIPAPPWPATVGKPINGHATCGAIQVDVSGSITGTSKQTVGGKSFDVVVAKVTITTHGQIESTSQQEQWWAPALRMPTHTHTTMSGKFGAFSFTSDVTQDLKSPAPH